MNPRQPPVCSIIVPTRDCRNYLPTAFASIDMQGIEGLEVIVVDDGSSDGTAEWLSGSARVHGEIRVLSTGGVGVASARNSAIAQARAGLIAFLDADDVWWPGKLAAQLAVHARRPALAMSFMDYIHMTPDGRTHGTSFDFWGGDWGAPDGSFVSLEDPESKLLATNAVGTSTVVVRKDAIERAGGFSLACKSAEDWDLWLRLAAIGEVATSRRVGMTYLMRPNGETAARARRIEAMRAIAGRYDGDSRPSIRRALRVAKSRLATADAELLACGQPSAAVLNHVRAFLWSPSLRKLREIAASSASAAARTATSRRTAA